MTLPLPLLFLCLCLKLVSEPGAIGAPPLFLSPFSVYYGYSFLQLAHWDLRPSLAGEAEAAGAFTLTCSLSSNTLPNILLLSQQCSLPNTYLVLSIRRELGTMGKKGRLYFC